MSNSIDNRVVSMEFDNAKFEKNVETSLNTLKHLDQSLDSLTNGSKAFDGVSFENIANGIDSIANKFTLMGRITLKVFDEIATGIVNLGKKLVSFNTDQVSAGWQKYADKTESVQTIMSATGREIEYVEEQLDRLNRFSDETSYSFVDMTSNIAKFTSQGISLDSAVTSMQGIATWAASAGQNAQAASRAMYNISQAMGTGAMHLIDWKSIQNANMATKQFKEQAIAAAVELGTLEKKNDKLFTKATGSAKALEVNIQTFADTLKNDWFTSDVMTKVFTEYGKFADLVDQTYEKFDEEILVSELIKLADAQKTASKSFERDLIATANRAGVDIEELRAAITALNAKEYEFSMQTYKAAQEAKTFKDAIDAAADAISTSWMKVFQTIFGNYEQSKVIWTDLANWFYDLFAQPINNLNDILDEVFNGFDLIDGSGLEKIQGDIKGVALDLLDMGDIAEKAFKDLGIVSEQDIKNFGSIREAIKHIDISADKIGNVIDSLLGDSPGASKNITTLKEAKKLISEIWHGDWSVGKERRDMLRAAGYDPKVVQAALNKQHAGFKLTEQDLIGWQTNVSKLSKEQIQSLTELRKRLDDGTASLKEYMETNRGMTGRELLFGKDYENDRVGALYHFIDAVNNIKEAVSEASKVIFGDDSDRISRIRTFLQVLQASAEKLSKLTYENETLVNAFKAVFTVLKIGFQAASAFVSAIKQIINLFKPSGEEAANFVDSLSKLIFKFDEWLQKNKIFEKAVNIVVGVFRALKAVLSPVVSEFKKFINDLKESESIQKAFSTLQYAFQNLTEKVRGLNSENKAFTTAIKAIVTVVRIVLNVIFAVITAIAQVIGLFAPGEEATSGFIETISKLIFKFDEWLEKNKAFEKITTVIVGVFRTLKNVFGDLLDLFSNLIKTGDVKGFISGLIEKFGGLSERMTGLKDTFKEWFSNLSGNNRVLASVGDGFGKIAKAARDLYSAKIGPTFTMIKNAISKISLQNIIQGFTNAKNGIVDFFKILWDFIKTGNWESFLSDISNRFSTVVGWIEKARDTLTSWFEGFDKNTLSALMSIVGGLLGLIGVFKLLNSFGSIKYAAIEFLGELSSTVKSFRRAKIATDITAIVVAIGVLVGALFLIRKIPATDLKRSISALGFILGAIATLVVILGIISNTKGATLATPIALSLAAFIAAIVLLVGALWVLTKMDYSNIWSALGVLAGIMAALGALAFATSKMKGSFAGGGLGLITYALGVLLLIKALKTIQNESSLLNVDTFKKLFGLIMVLVGMGIAMRNVRFSSAVGIILLAASLTFVQKKVREAMENGINFEEFKKYSEELVTIFGILLGFSLALRVAGKGGLGTAVSLLALIALMFVVANAIERLGIIPEDQLLQGVKAISAIGIVFAALIFALGQAGKINKEGMKSLRAVVLGLTGLMIALVVLSAIPWPALKQGLLAMLGVMAAFSIVLVAASTFMKWSRSLNGWKVAGILVVVLGMIALMQLLSSISSKVENADSLIATAESMGIVMLALAGAFYIIGNTKVDAFDPKKTFTIFADALAMLVPVVAALWAIQKFNIQASLPTVLALSVLLLALATAFRIVNDSKNYTNGVIETGVAFALGAGAIIGIAFAMQMLNDVKTDGLIEKVAAVSALLLAMTASLFVLSKANFDIKDLGTAALGMTGMIAILAIIALMLPMLNEMPDIDGLLPKVLAISTLLLALSGAVLVLSFMPAGGFGAAAGGVLIVGEMMAVLGAIFGLFGFVIEKINGSDESGLTDAASWIIQGAEVLGEAIGKFVGAFVGGVVNGAIQAASDLDGFAKSLEPFMDQLERFDDTSISGIAALSGMLLSLAAADFASSIATIVGWLTGVPTNMGASLKGFADAIKEYIDTLSDMEASDIDKVSKITNSISSLLANMPKEGGIFSAFTGSTSRSFKKLGENMGDFGGAIKSFVESVSDIPSDAAVKAETAIQTANKIVDFSKTLQKSGGLIQSITGIQDIGLFGDQLTEFIDGLFGNKRERKQGFIKALDEAEIDDADATEKLTKIKSVLDIMVDIFRSIPTMGGFIEKAIGGTDSEGFVTSISTFIDGLKKILDKMVGLDESGTAVEDLRHAKEIALALAEFNAAINGQNLDLSQKTDAEGNAINSITDGICGAINNILNLDTLGAQEKIDTIRAMFNGTDLFGEAGMAGLVNLDGLTQGLSTFEETIDAGMTNMVTSVDENGALVTEGLTTFVEDTKVTLDAANQEATEKGEEYTTGYATGIENKKSDVTAKGSVLVRAANSALSTAPGSARTYGAQYGQGFANGIASKEWEVRNAVQQLANAANHTLTVTLRIESPSKVARGYGEFYGEGFAIGINSTADAVTKASQNIANASTVGLSTALDIINDIVESDAQPVITPVLDLSEVRRGVASITDIDGISANVGYAGASAVMRETSQNAAGNASQIQNGMVPSIQFNQYNSSPKSLSRIEIYRQTKNLISMQREAASV